MLNAPARCRRARAAPLTLSPLLPPFVIRARHLRRDARAPRATFGDDY